MAPEYAQCGEPRAAGNGGIGAPGEVADPSPSLRRSAPADAALIVIAILAAIAAARIARPFLVPLISAIVLSYPLRPTVSMLERMGMPRYIAAVLVIAVLVAGAWVAVYAVRGNLNDAVAELPVAARKLRHAVAKAEHQPRGTIARMKDAAAELDKVAVDASDKAPAAPPPPAAGVSGWAREFLANQSGDALGVLAEIVLTLMLALFLLSAGDTFRRKIAKLAGASLARRRVAVEILNEIDSQIQAYMRTMLASNVLIALVTTGALLFLGVRSAWMLGTATGVFHIIPYVGTIVSAAAVGVATFVDTGSASRAVIAMGVVATIAAGIGMVFATWMQGRASSINPAAVFVGVFFFGWLWGGWGLLLGVPMLTVLKSVADRVDAMRPIRELLAIGNTPSSPVARSGGRDASMSRQRSAGGPRRGSRRPVSLGN